MLNGLSLLEKDIGVDKGKTEGNTSAVADTKVILNVE